jgi:hypothetical protein
MKVNLLYDYISPCGYLPNALNPSYITPIIKNDFIINHKVVDDFEKGVGAISSTTGENVIYPIVNKSFSVADVLNGFENCEYVNSEDSIFLYILAPYGGASSFYGYDGTYNENKSFFHFIPKNTIKLIQQIPNIYLFINYASEGTIDLNWFNIIHTDAKKFEIPLNKIIYCASDYFIEMNYNIWKRMYNINDNDNIKLLYLNWSLVDKARELNDIYDGNNTTFNQYSNQCSIVKDTDIDFTKIRDKRFLMLNRRLRPHRVYSICFYEHLNIINEFLISYDITSMQLYDISPDNIKMHIEDDNYMKIIIKQFYKLKKENPKKTIDYDDLENVWGFNFENKEPYLSSYIHITSETNFFELGGYFSEKTWKPIGHLQPFVFMGPAYGLEELKKLGFKTFSPFIDESYDLELDPERRFKMIIDEIYRLSQLPIEEMHNWYNSIFNDILLYNQKKLFNYTDYAIDKNIIENKFKQLFYGNT